FLEVDPTLPVAFDLLPQLDWVPEGDAEEAELRQVGLSRGAYGYLDAHPLAVRRVTPVCEYLADRLSAVAQLVPGAREFHVRLAAFEGMREDGFLVAEVLHRHGLRVDVWTLNAGMSRWRERLARALAAGVDVITSDTPRVLASASHEDSC